MSTPSATVTTRPSALTTLAPLEHRLDLEIVIVATGDVEGDAERLQALSRPLHPVANL